MVQRSLELVLVATRNNDIVDLQHHATKLRGQHQLLPLSNQWVNNERIPHVVAAGLHTVNAQSAVLLRDLTTLDAGQGFDGGETGILGESHGHGVEGIGESAHSVLLEAGGLDRCVFDGEGAGNFGSSSSVHDTIVSDKVAHNTESVVEGALGFIDNLGVT